MPFFSPTFLLVKRKALGDESGQILGQLLTPFLFRMCVRGRGWVSLTIIRCTGKPPGRWHRLYPGNFLFSFFVQGTQDSHTKKLLFASKVGFSLGGQGDKFFFCKQPNDFVVFTFLKISLFSGRVNKLEEPVYLMDTKICSFSHIFYEIKTWTIAKSISNKTKQKKNISPVDKNRINGKEN